MFSIELLSVWPFIMNHSQVIVPSAHADAKVVSGDTRFSRKERWFCAGDGSNPRLCPAGTFQVRRSAIQSEKEVDQNMKISRVKSRGRNRSKNMIWIHHSNSVQNSKVEDFFW